MLEDAAPVLSLGVLYVFAVLPVAVVWGTAVAVAVAVLSMLAFNFLFLPPLYTFTLTDSENWVALGVYLVTAVVVSDLAARARSRAAEAQQRAREASFLARTSAALLESEHVQDRLAAIGTDAARTLGSPQARIEFESRRRPEPTETTLALTAGERHVGLLVLPRDSPYDPAAAERVLPGLASLLAVAGDRERLARRAVEAETLRRSDAVKTAILRSVSHDLRTPLTTMRAATEALTSSTLALDDADRAELVEAVRIESRRLAHLVENLLELSRLEAGAARPRRELLTLDDLVGRTLAGFDREADRIRVELPDGLPPVRVDGAQVERILHNLVDNALKFSPEQCLVEITAEGREGEVLVRIADHGPGIPAGEVARIFEPFEHAVGGAPGHGVGLGLAVARGFADANQGLLWAEETPGGGATFVLSLPATPVPTGAVA